ncbi:type II toxin-antitoxin system RelE/ParE family toxin [Caminibacter pacificus]
MYKLVETKTYMKKLKKFLKKNPQIMPKYEKTIVLLENNPYHSSLRLHKLSGKLQNFYSVSIDMNYRIIVDFIIIEDKIFLIDIGTHDDIY